MQPSQLIDWKFKLEAKKKELEETLRSLMRPEQRETPKDFGESAQIKTAEIERARRITEKSVEINRLSGALRRIDLGMFGVCRTCGEEIPEIRLNALPHALLCITCETRDPETSAPTTPVVHEHRSMSNPRRRTPTAVQVYSRR